MAALGVPRLLGGAQGMQRDLLWTAIVIEQQKGLGNVSVWPLDADLWEFYQFTQGTHGWLQSYVFFFSFPVYLIGSSASGFSPLHVASPILGFLFPLSSCGWIFPKMNSLKNMRSPKAKENFQTVDCNLDGNPLIGKILYQLSANILQTTLKLGALKQEFIIHQNNVGCGMFFCWFHVGSLKWLGSSFRGDF